MGRFGGLHGVCRIQGLKGEWNFFNCLLTEENLATTVGVTPTQVILGCIRKVVEEVMEKQFLRFSFP